MKYGIIYITTGSMLEAEAIADALVGEQLAACCTIISNVHSIYRWEGRVQNDEEYLILCKTELQLYPLAERRIRELHSYDVPEIIMVPIEKGSEDYLQWISASIRPPGPADSKTGVKH